MARRAIIRRFSAQRAARRGGRRAYGGCTRGVAALPSPLSGPPVAEGYQGRRRFNRLPLAALVV
jgi:hypothetical protein